MPVHLGSMDESIKAVIRSHTGSMRPGDVYVLNAPYNGGTHLPCVSIDVSVAACRLSSVVCRLSSVVCRLSSAVCRFVLATGLLTNSFRRVRIAGILL
jgi:hypothetical protein